MKCSVFIATSMDGYIARPDGSVDWLHSAGKQNVDMGRDADMGFTKYMGSIDCMIMGRKCMETLSAMNLGPREWPYGDTRIIVLSKTLSEAPSNLADRVEMFDGDIGALVKLLEREGYAHAYIDGGMTIQNFLKRQLIREMIITRAPVLLGEGIPLFGNNGNELALANIQTKTFPNDFVQVRFEVKYS